MKNQKLILIRGPAASGKTTLSQKVANKIKPSVVLHKDIFIYDVDFFEKIEYKYKAQVIMLLLSEFYLRKKVNVIVEGVFGEKDVVSRISQFKKIAKKCKAKFSLFSINAKLETCIKRGKTKKKKIKIKDIKKWHKYFYKAKLNKGVWIDTDKISIAQVTKKMLELIKRG